MPIKLGKMLKAATASDGAEMAPAATVVPAEVKT
jgi:hypothetical protein